MLDSVLHTDAAHADADHWVVPDEWWAAALPVRGLGPRRPVALRPTAADEEAERAVAHRDFVLATFANSHRSPELVTAGTAALDDPDTCSPLGAAVLAFTLEWAKAEYRHPADAWVQRRGLCFAAEAAVLRAGLTAQSDWDRTGRTLNYRISRILPNHPGYSSVPDCLVRVREILAQAPADEYRAAIARLAVLRSTPDDLAIRIATSFVAPTEQDWVKADLGALDSVSPEHRDRFVILTASVGDRADFDHLTTVFGTGAFFYGSSAGLLATALTRFGPECTGAIDRMLRERDLDGDIVTKLARILAEFPTDDAFTALLARIEQRSVPAILAEAAHRYPHRALRLLGPLATRSGAAQHILRGIGCANPELAAQLPESTGFLDTRRLSIATPADLPEVLRTAPWQHARKKAKQITIPDLAQPIPEGLSWLPGEQQDWAATPVPSWRSYEKDWSGNLARGVKQKHGDLLQIIALAPDELARPYLASVRLDRDYVAEVPLRRILGRFDADAIEFVVHAVLTNPTKLLHLLAPVTGSTVALAMIRGLDGKSTRTTASVWIERHHLTALPVLIATALSKPSKDRRNAEAALRTLTVNGHREAVATAAAEFGDRAHRAVIDIIEANPLDQLPPKLPTIPNWLVPEALPALRLRDADTVFAAEAIRDICLVLAMCGPTGDYAGAAQVIAAADPDSAAEFAWGIFEAWHVAGYPPKDGWVLHALGLLGNDETARRVGALIRVWPGQSAHARAVTALDVLTTLGSDAALTQLHGIAEKVKFKGLKTKAQEKIAEVAEALELTPEQLADRLVPDFGLNSRGTMVLDYGPRAFVIGFDEQLTPTIYEAIRDADNVWQPAILRKSLPKPGAKDDPELSDAAYKSFAILKKDAKSAAADQIRRFERAMVNGRRWSATEHRTLFVEHPLLWHLTRRLVWATFDETGAATGSFRMAEDRSYTDSTDEPITLPDEAIVGLAHPLHLGDALGAWGEIFADYEILQPFPQLQRETDAFTPEEATHNTLPRFQDLTIPTGKILGLSRFGWERGAPADGGVSCEYFRPLGDNRSIVIDLEPGIIAGDAMEFDQQKITVRLARTGEEDYWFQRDSSHVFADLSPITASEVLRELNALLS